MSFLKRMFTSFHGTSVLSQSRSHKNHKPSEERRYAQKTPGSIDVAKAPRNTANFQQSVSKDKTDILDDLPTTTSLAEDESRGRQRSVRECTQEPNVIKHVGPFLPKSVESCGSSKPTQCCQSSSQPLLAELEDTAQRQLQPDPASALPLHECTPLVRMPKDDDLCSKIKSSSPPRHGEQFQSPCSSRSMSSSSTIQSSTPRPSPSWTNTSAASSVEIIVLNGDDPLAILAGQPVGVIDRFPTLSWKISTREVERAKRCMKHLSIGKIRGSYCEGRK